MYLVISFYSTNDCVYLSLNSDYYLQSGCYFETEGRVKIEKNKSIFIKNESLSADKVFILRMWNILHLIWELNWGWWKTLQIKNSPSKILFSDVNPVKIRQKWFFFLFHTQTKYFVSKCYRSLFVFLIKWYFANINTLCGTIIIILFVWFISLFFLSVFVCHQNNLSTN